MTESTFLPEWDTLYSLFLLLFLNKMRALLVWNGAVSQCFLHKNKSQVKTCTNFGPHADVHRGVRADPGRCGWMTIFTPHVPEDPRRHADVESMNRP